MALNQITRIKIFLLTSLLIVVLMVVSQASMQPPFTLLEIPMSGDIGQPEYADNSETDQATESPSLKKRKSKTKAVLLSFLVPGAGQFYLGKTGRAELFVGVEVLTWIGFAALQHSAAWKKQGYIDFAVQHAGIDPSGKDDDFYKNLVFYDSRDEYNDWRAYTDPGSQYYENVRGTYWQWDDSENRTAFRDMRNKSKRDYRNANFMIGVAVLNRVVAALDAFRIARKDRGQSGTHGTSPDDTFKIDVDADPFGADPSVGITLIKKF